MSRPFLIQLLFFGLVLRQDSDALLLQHGFVEEDGWLVTPAYRVGRLRENDRLQSFSDERNAIIAKLKAWYSLVL